MRNVARVVAISGVLASLNSQPAFAIILNLAPPFATVTVGGTVDVDVVASGLGNHVAPSIGAIDLNVGFDTSLLSPTTVAFGPLLGTPSAEALTDFSFATPRVVNFAEVSLLSPSDLEALQPSSPINA